MATIENLFDNINQYKDDIESLVNTAKILGIDTFDQFLEMKKEYTARIPAAMLQEIKDRYENSDDLDWEEAKSSDTEQAYNNYLSSHKEGAHREEARNALDKFHQAEINSHANDEWGSIDKDSIQELQEFINKYPDNPHVAEAKSIYAILRAESYLGLNMTELINRIRNIDTDASIIDKVPATVNIIKQYLAKKYIKVNELIEQIRNDHNFLRSGVIKELYADSIITDDDFSGFNVDEEYIKRMFKGDKPVKFKKPSKINRITKYPCTEIYFWGIPSSGKTCALGAILSSASDGKTVFSLDQDIRCQGHAYMDDLIKLFKNQQVSILPAGTSTNAIYEMAFDLTDNDKKVHPITCIDMAGELIECIYNVTINEPLNVDQQDAFEIMNDILIKNRTQNRKIHFFVIEYGAQDKTFKGKEQGVLLKNVALYLRDSGIFKNDTDAIYILLTKIDKANKKGADLTNEINNHINTYYGDFKNGMKLICAKNEINNKQLEALPFSILEVCFQDFCKFNDKSAKNIVNIIVQRSFSEGKGHISNLFRQLKK